jgi:hypothetical protein
VLSTAFDGVARLHALKTGQLVKEFGGHESYVNQGKFSPDCLKMEPAKKDTKTPEGKQLSPKQEAVRKASKDLRQVEAKKRLYRKTVSQYEHVKSRFTAQIDKLNSTTGATDEQAKTNKKDMVVAVYKLLRNFCISFNTIDMSDNKEDK